MRFRSWNGSADTAKVICGVIGRTMHIIGATTKATLIANGLAPGAHFCHACEDFFSTCGAS